MPKEVLAVGTPYTEELVQQIKESGLDAMLENGEAHTLVFPRSWKKY
jgi:diphthamide synthase (EF-2-diphthine--ammonia ligase)